MRSWARPTAHVALLTAGFVAFGSGVGFADTTSGDGGAGSGNQINAPISVPIDVSGNSAAGAGQSAASSTGGATVKNKGSGGRTTSGDGGLLSGNQLNAPISAPISGCGNSLAIGGQSSAECEGGASVHNSGGGGGGTTSGVGGVLSGNQAHAPVSAPADLCGNSVAVFGTSNAGCGGGASVRNKGGSANDTTSGDGGLVAGNQADAPISAPVDICGNSVAVGGQSFATCEGGAEVTNHGSAGGGSTSTSSGDGSVGGGNQVYAPVSAPVEASGNAVAGLGQSSAFSAGGAEVHNGAEGGASRHLAAGDGMTTSGNGGLIAGNQIVAPISVPVNVCGNALAVAGQALAMCEGGASVHNAGEPGATTSGDVSVLGGNQVVVPVSVPVNVCGNAAAVLGMAAAMCEGGADVVNASAGGTESRHMAASDVESGVPSGSTGSGPVTPGLPEAPLPEVGGALPLAASTGGGPVTPGLPEAPLPEVGGKLPLAASPAGGLDGLPELPELPGVGTVPLAKGKSPALPGTGVVKQTPGWAPQATTASRQLTPGGPNVPVPGVRSPRFAPRVTEGRHVMVPGAPTLPTRNVGLPRWAPQTSMHAFQVTPGSPRLPMADVYAPAWSPGVAASAMQYAPGTPTIPLYRPVMPAWASGPVAATRALPQHAGEAVRGGDTGGLPGAGLVQKLPVAGGLAGSLPGGGLPTGGLPTGGLPAGGGDAAGTTGKATDAVGGLPVLGSAVSGATEGGATDAVAPVTEGAPATEGAPVTGSLPATEGLPLAGAVSEGTDLGQGGPLGGLTGGATEQLPVVGGLAPVSAVASLASDVGTYFSLALAAAFVAGSGLLMAARRVSTRRR